MKTSHRAFNVGSHHEQGVAIVIILAFLVLLTGVAVAFFSRATSERQVSNSSASQSKADSLARGALEVITGDLKQEIVVGSTVPPRAGGAPIYVPSSKNFVVPTRGNTSPPTPDPLPNLIRESTTTNCAVSVVGAVNGSPLIGVGSGAGASLNAVSSTTPSANGRSIGLARWNSHYLIARPATGTGGTTSTNLDSTPVSAFTAPSWVAVTRENGPTVLSPSNPLQDSKGNTVTPIGRYAYAIYDEGGLLDANVAGYPSAMTATQLGAKGLLAFADLTQLPTYNAAVPPTPLTFFPQAQVDNIVGWRNYATTQPNGSLDMGYSFSTDAVARYLNFLASPRDFLSVNPLSYPSPATPASRTDQRFTSRQALLRFWNTLIANSNNGSLNDPKHLQDVLPYLGTFSRELNAPSWSPANPDLIANPNATTKYGDQAESTASVNRDIPNVRFRKAGSFTRFRVDGTFYTKTFQPGDSVVQMRFPLGRIAWLTAKNADGTYSPGPAPGISSVAIQQHFGLLWDASNLCWDYVGNQGSIHNPVSAIETLDEIAQEGREPNFFELLKAGILSGSLGKTAANPAAVAPTFKNGVSTWLDTARDDVNVDLQVIRIGVNVIDQASPSMVPTDIKFSNNEVSPPVIVDAIGTKSLPYIAWIPYVPHRPEKFPDRNMIGLYFAVEVWNPHQNANGAQPAGSPTKFRIRPTQGKVQFGVYQRSTKAIPFPGSVPLNTQDYITFTRDATVGRTFVDPTFLTPAFASGTNPDDSCTITKPATLSGTTVGNPAPTTQQGNQGFVGFNTGFYDLHDSLITGVATDMRLDTLRAIFTAVPSEWPCFEAQVQDSTGWHTYQQVNYMIGTDAGGDVWQNGWQFLSTQISMYNPDPRTERFGAFGGHGISGSSLVGPGTWAQQQTGPSINNAIHGTFSGGTPGGLLGSTGWYPPDRLAANPNGYPDVALASLALNNMSNQSAGYAWAAYLDPDGILREGDATGSSSASMNPAKARYPIIPNTGVPTTTHMGDRPVMLNRPYRSVGELGYAFRDMPWKTLDFFTKNSADSALLDLFTTSDSEVTAGKFNLNTHNAPVLQTMLAKAIVTEILPLGASTSLALSAAPTINAQAATFANGLVNYTNDPTKGPLLNRADLVPMFASLNLGAATTNAAINMDVKTQREVTVRALAESGSTRTWNLLIDVIAQAGRYPPNATTLDKFNVEGERRYWLHVAIDRFTGKVVDEQLESVYE